MPQENPSDLFGYDFVYLAQAKSINNQFKRLFTKEFHKKSKYLTWMHRPGDSDPVPDSTISFGPPEIIILDRIDTKIDVLFPYQTGIVVFDNTPMPLDGCGLRCTVDVKETVVTKANVLYAPEAGVALDKNGALLDQDTLIGVRQFLSDHPFDLKQFFIRLDELRYAEDAWLDLLHTKVKWSAKQRMGLEKMTEQVFEDLKQNDITLTIGFVPYRENDHGSDQPGSEYKLIHTNMRVLPYYDHKSGTSSGLVYCMVMNKDGKLPLEQPFKMDLGADEEEEPEEGVMILKREILSGVIFETIKNGASRYDEELMGENPFVEAFISAAKENTDHFKVKCGNVNFLVGPDKDQDFYRLLVDDHTDADIDVTLTYSNDSPKIKVRYDMSFKILKHTDCFAKDHFRIVAEISSQYEISEGIIQAKDSDFQLIDMKKDEIEDILKREDLTKEQYEDLRWAAILDKNLMAKHVKWMAFADTSQSAGKFASSCLLSVMMFGNEQFWYKNLRFVEKEQCPLIFMTTTYRNILQA